MDTCRLTGQRVGDIVNMRNDQITGQGIWFKQQKTGNRPVASWSDELRAIVDRTQKIGAHGVPTVTLFSQRGGKPLKITTLQPQRTGACKRAGINDAQLRALRTMAGTGAKRQGLAPAALPGHSDPEMTRRYLRDRAIPVGFANRITGQSNKQPL
ncbi:tyrosine-type recombinase/integrase [Laribacter hongkongensis]|nr:tyrosine-type recombinase/integrase [Laribacter hongkongensis]